MLFTTVGLKVVNVLHFRYFRYGFLFNGEDEMICSNYDNFLSDTLTSRGGATVVVAENKLGGLYLGMSVCSKQDQYNRRIGRLIAMGRADDAWLFSRPMIGIKSRSLSKNNKLFILNTAMGEVLDRQEKNPPRIYAEPKLIEFGSTTYNLEVVN